MASLSTEILINLAGNLTAKARQYGANMSEFASRNQRAMSIIKSTSEAAGRGLDSLGNRYTTLLAGFAGGAALKEFAATDRRLTQLGIAAGKTREEMRTIFSGIQDTAIKFRVDDAELLAAIENVNKTTGDLDFGIKNKETIAASLAASGSEGASIGGLVATFQKFQLKSDQETLQAMDVANKLGKEGAFELKDAAEKSTAALSMYASAGGNGVEGIKQGLVVLNVARDATGDSSKAATATENLIRDLQLPKVVETLRKQGINVYGDDGRMRELSTLLAEVAKKSGSKGAEKQNARLLDAGFNQDSILLISGVTSGKGAENLKRYQSVVADGTGIMADAKYAAEDFTSAMESLETTWGKFANSNLAGPVQDLADAINSVDQDTVQNWLETGKYIGIAVAGVIAARKAFKLGKGAWDIVGNIRGKGGKGGAGGMADVLGSGVMPVYVVNMGAGGMGNGNGLPGSGGSPSTGTGTGGKQGPGGKPVGGKPGLGVGAMGMASRAGGALGLAYTATEVYDYIATEHPEAIEFDKMLMDKWDNFWAGNYREPLKQWSTDLTGVDLKANANPDFAVEEKSWDPYQINGSSQNDIPQHGTLIETFRDVLNEINALTNESASAWESFRNEQNNQALLPPVPQELRGELRVIVEGDARVKSVKVNQPGVTLSASAGVSNVGQS